MTNLNEVTFGKVQLERSAKAPADAQSLALSAGGSELCAALRCAGPERGAMHENFDEEGSGSGGTNIGDLILIFIGILLGATASIGINVGNNIQSLGLQEKERGGGDRLFNVGTTIFVTASLINFAAFAFAPAAILVCAARPLTVAVRRTCV